MNHFRVECVLNSVFGAVSKCHIFNIQTDVYCAGSVLKLDSFYTCFMLLIHLAILIFLVKNLGRGQEYISYTVFFIFALHYLRNILIIFPLIVILVLFVEFKLFFSAKHFICNQTEGI